MRELVIIEPLPVPAPTNPTPKLPDWLETIGESLRQNCQSDPATGKWVDCRTLIALPTPSQQLAMAGHRKQLVALLELTPINDANCAMQTLTLIGKLMLAKPARSGGPEVAEARGETYTAALDDVSYWAVELAIRKWHRGQCGSEFDYKWAPESADLRKLALRETSEVHRRIETIDRVLHAVPYRDCAAERKENLAALAAVLAGKAKGLSRDEAAEVGKDLVQTLAA